ncbi:MAG: hypothetical protein FWD44_02105 [Oscillospiraceae bacterium]|nr:hypothetical protein [Oscillospiraceae bacterium]
MPKKPLTWENYKEYEKRELFDILRRKIKRLEKKIDELENPVCELNGFRGELIDSTVRKFIEKNTGKFKISDEDIFKIFSAYSWWEKYDNFTASELIEIMESVMESNLSDPSSLRQLTFEFDEPYDF